MGLVRYIARRAIYTVILLFVIVVFNFFLFQVLPFVVDCPDLSVQRCADILYLPPPPSGHGNETAVILHEIAVINATYGFAQPIPTRFALYVRNMFTFNFGVNIGPSSGFSGPVINTILHRLPYTVLLLGASTAAAFAFGIGLAVIAAAKRGRPLDVSSLAVLLFLNALPVFFLGSMLELGQLLSLGSYYVPIGRSTLLAHGWSFAGAVLSSFWLPFVTLTMAGLGGVFLTQRAVMIDTMSEDYILMARAKGVSERSVLYKHAFRNAVLPVATAFALSLGFILSGAVITETVFTWPGLGLAIYQGITSTDFPLEQAMFFIISVMVLLAVFSVDIAYGFIDPRVSTA